MKRFRTSIFIGLILITAQSYGQTDKILIAAASDLKFALDSVVSSFKSSNTGAVEVTYGSSGKLSEQISNGAPFDVFFSADISYPNLLKSKNLLISDIYPYGVGRVVIWSNKLDPNTQGINSLVNPSIKKIAIANPTHAPYGKRAEESLTYYKILDKVKDKIVYGENISQTAQFITTGAADIGIVALSLALSPNMKNQKGKYYLIPEESHQPLIQGMALTTHARENNLALKFEQFVKSAKATQILRYFGFSKP